MATRLDRYFYVNFCCPLCSWVYHNRSSCYTIFTKH